MELFKTIFTITKDVIRAAVLIGLLIGAAWVLNSYNGDTLQKTIIFAVGGVLFWALLPRGASAPRKVERQPKGYDVDGEPVSAARISHLEQQRAEWLEVAAELEKDNEKKPSVAKKKQLISINDRIFRIDAEIAKIKAGLKKL